MSNYATKTDLKNVTHVDASSFASKTNLASLKTEGKALTAVENKISEIENKFNNHNHYKYITTPEFSTMAADLFKARLAAQTDLI